MKVINRETALVVDFSGEDAAGPGIIHMAALKAFAAAVAKEARIMPDATLIVTVSGHVATLTFQDLQD